jgi:hypothetical protein
LDDPSTRWFDSLHWLLFVFQTKQQQEAERTGIPVNFERHQHVEMLLGVYARQFSIIQQEANFLLSRINSRQEFIELELDLYRNRLIRMDVDLGILAVATGKKEHSI